MNDFLLTPLYSFFHSALILVFLAYILRLKKPPASTLAWFLLVFIQPILGVILYSIIGNRKIKKRNRKNSQKRSNQKIEFLGDGISAFNNLIQKIDEAQTSIYLETFIFANDEVGRVVLQKLTKRAQEGLDVRILLDSMGTLMTSHPSFTKFEEAGGKFEMFMPLFHWPFHEKMNLRNHRKLVLVDEKFAIIGGMNIATEYLGPKPNEKRWSDIVLLIEGETVIDALHMFLDDWAYATKSKKEKFSATPSEIKNTHVSQLVSSGPDVEADAIYEWLLSAIFSAKKRIWLTTPYFIPDENLMIAMKIAVKRGVDLRLMIPAKSNHRLADLSGKTYIEEVHSSGIKVLRFPKMTHAKVILIDDDCGMVTSANLDSRSLLINYEAGVALYSPSEITQLEAWFEDKFASCEEGVEKPTPVDNLLGSVARLFGPII
jgi:cardiolipin synthase A/B